jgi:hypothetical protein
LSRFPLIFDAPHRPLFAMPDTVAKQASISKDNIGLCLAGLPTT